MNNQDDDEFGDAIAFRGAPQESLAFAVLIAGLLGLALWAFLEDFGGASLIYRIFLLLALLLCLWPVASGIHNAFRGRRTMLAIGARGLFDWRISDDWVSWSSIAEVDVLRASKGCLVFYPDPNVPLGFREKILSRINRTLGDWSANPPLRVGMLGVGADLDQVVEALDRYFPQWRQRGGRDCEMAAAFPAGRRTSTECDLLPHQVEPIPCLCESAEPWHKRSEMNAPASLPSPDATLLALLRPQRLTAVVDVGANPIDGETPYQNLLSKRICTITGFEPQADGLAFLNQRKSDLETYLPYVIGDGSPQTLHVTAMPGMTSLFEPNFPVLEWFNGFAAWSVVQQKVPVQTRRLDDLTEVAAIDMLKIDVQGAELMVFKGGQEKLKRAVAVHTEVCFLHLYKDQPLFGEVDLELRSLGFVPHHLHHVNRRTILPAYSEGAPNSALNQVLFADIIYVRDFTKAELMDAEQLKHLALVAHHCYGSHDLVIHCLFRLIERNAIAPNAVDLFVASTRAAFGV